MVCEQLPDHVDEQLDVLRGYERVGMDSNAFFKLVHCRQ